MLSVYNQRYFVAGGKPIYLLGDGFYYPIVNAAFDVEHYLNQLAEAHINYTRVWLIIPIRQRGNDGSDDYGGRWTRYPVPMVMPWARTGTASAYDGEPQYDLRRFDPAYWERLRHFLDLAQRRDIFVEVTIFDRCLVAAFPRGRWPYHPFNQLNGGPIDDPHDGYEFFNIRNEVVRQLQELLVKKTLQETMDFDNVIYEVCNEYDVGPWEWERYWIRFLAERMDHPVSANHLHPPTAIYRDEEALTIVNIHTNPFRWDAGWIHQFLTLYADWEKPIVVDETYPYKGRYVKSKDPDLIPAVADYDRFTGATGSQVRNIAWATFTAGAHFNLLDHSYHENPTYAHDSSEVRTYSRHLSDFVNSVSFWEMRPRDELILSKPTMISSAFCFASEDESVLYFLGRASDGDRVKLRLAPGRYEARFYNPASGHWHDASSLDADGGVASLALPAFREDLACHVVRVVAE